jgi:hypothetical protein
VFDDAKADERKMKEFYGNSKHQPLTKDFWREKPENGAYETNMKQTTLRKANELNS